MASSSSTQSWNHDVYLSFRGEDTRKNFVDHLYTALQKRGILTFIDNETLAPGEPIAATLLKAIEESRIAVVVFSQHYADSFWCLDELAYIMKCSHERGQIVIPIFYQVEPSDVRNQRGNFEQAFRRVENYNEDRIGSWRNALVYASNLNSGYMVDSRESICIKHIVSTVWNKLLPFKQVTQSQDPEHGGAGDWFYNHSKQINSSKSSSLLNSGPYYAPSCSSMLRNHDVFINFRGLDTRDNFVDHLSSALEQQGIHAYKDEELARLDKNDVINSSHLKAIKESRMSLIILSRGYAASSFCLDELEYIMKCRDETGQIVIPIFYHVDSYEVRYQRGSFSDPFSKHESNNNKKLAPWRKALTDVSNLFGLDISNLADGYEAKGIKLIVDKISKILFPDKDLVGLQTRLENMKYGSGGMIKQALSSHEDVEHLRIPLQEISQATNSFSIKNIIARGGFGKVYLGQSEKHGTIAIKQLDRSMGQGDHEFMMEIALLSTYKHENLVSLVGFCEQDNRKLLVYKYESNGSLDKHLHSKDLTWIQRLKICLDAANGLKYLHDDIGSQHRILHRDIKSSNILLDENWKAKISDFGLSKIALANVPCSVIISGACGTMGYIDPQYQEHNILTQKSDVYSFGVVLFEVLCGRLVNVRKDERYFSAKLAQNHYEKETLDDIIDSDLRNQMNSDALTTFSTIAYRCLKKHREERPTISLVVDQLEKALGYQQGLSEFWHDVYISFRQRDTECHIVDDIRSALHHEGVSTYKDDVTLSRKKSVLVKAIERSRLFVIVFTKKFAMNSWYLDEVAKIIECMKEKRQLVLPVFYNVSRSDVRTQKGYFGEVISEYDTHPKMEAWRNALVEATNAVGLEYSKFRSSMDLVKKVVEEIKNGLSAEDKLKV